MQFQFLWLLVAHAIADYPLQGDWLSIAKNPEQAPVRGQTIWPMALASHALIHAGAVQILHVLCKVIWVVAPAFA